MNNPTEKLEAAARAALAAGASRARAFAFDGKQYVVKRLAEQSRSLTQILFMRWLVKRLTGQPLPLRTLALRQEAGAMDYEAGRLRKLAAAGVRVPAVLLVTPEFFVLEHCGTVVASQLKHWPPETFRPVMLRLVRELGDFHRAGHWHGGAQIKNLTLHDELSYRIDFEENFGDFLPLAVSQANDLMLFLNSVSLAGPVNEAESRSLLPQLLDAYFAVYPNDEIRHVIRRALPLLRVFAALIRPFQRFSRKGIRRVLILADLLGEV